MDTYNIIPNIFTSSIVISLLLIKRVTIIYLLFTLYIRNTEHNSMQHYAFNFQCYEHIISIIFVTPCSDHDHVVLTTYIYLVSGFNADIICVYIYIIFCSILYSSVIEICIISRTSISFKALIPGSMTNKYNIMVAMSTSIIIVGYTCGRVRYCVGIIILL